MAFFFWHLFAAKARKQREQEDQEEEPEELEAPLATEDSHKELEGELEDPLAHAYTEARRNNSKQRTKGDMSLAHKLKLCKHPFAQLKVRFWGRDREQRGLDTLEGARNCFLFLFMAWALHFVLKK